MMVARPASDAAGSGRSEAEDARSRIVVGLDTSFLAREALALAARLASSVDARLKGVFVEDENLLHLASLPFAREISLSGEVRPVDPERMVRAMHAQAETARRVLARMASQAHVEWSFDVLRGRPLASLTASACAEDVIVIRSPDTSARELGRAVRAATRDTRADVLLVARGVALKGAFEAQAPVRVWPVRVWRGEAVLSQRPLVALDEGSSSGESCAAFVETLARRIGAPFWRLAARGLAPADIAQAARRAGAGLLVVNADWLGDDEDAARLSAAAGCPVLLLGGERAPLHAVTTNEGG